MTAARKPALDRRAQAALSELRSLITQHYPAAQFSVRAGIDDPEAIQLWATVDVEDTDQVIDCVIDRVLELQLEGLPIHVIPVRPRERVLAMRTAAHAHAARHSSIQL